MKTTHHAKGMSAPDTTRVAKLSPRLAGLRAAVMKRYGDIAVRVAGFSQTFKLVPPDLQEHIIARTKHRS